MNRATPAWHASVVARIVVLYSLLAAAIIALLGWLSYRGSRGFLLQTEEAAMRHAAETVRLKFQSAVGDLVRDTVQLSRSPTLREFVRNSRTGERERWQRIVEDAFRAMLEGKPSYFQVRLIGIADNGAEIIRLDNQDGFIVATSPERLQRKGDRDYFREALRTPGGAVYLSQISLNRDFGRLTEPHLPTLRALKLIEDDAGTLYGFLAINLDLRPLMAELSRLAGADARLILAKDDGEYILHPEPGLAFASETGGAATFTRDFAPPSSVPAAPEQWRLRERGGELVMYSRFRIADESEREIVAAITRPADSLVTGLRDARNRALRYTVLAALAGVLLVILLARLLAGRLRRLTSAVADYEIGRGMKNLPPPGRDEVGVLAARFRELDERVTDSLSRMAAAVKAREDFLAVMSHEIRTPMNAVLGTVRALEGGLPPERQAPLIKSLGSAARNLMALLDDALDYSKLRAGRMELSIAPVALRELIEDVAQTHRPLAERKGVVIETRIAAALPAVVKGDAVRIGQVLHNLASNAVKFTAAGRVVISAEPEEGKVRFAVADSGSGIPAEMLPRVFEPFDQAGADVAARFGGTGLGLTITRELVRLMGGELEVASTPGEGSVFFFALALEPSTLPAKPAAVRAGGLKGRRLLYIEDVASNCEVMALILEGSGAELVTAGTGAEAVQKLEREKFDVILLDLQLPDTTGIALAPRLRALSAAPVIAVTAQATPAAREECAAAGIRAVVTKPVEPEQLHAEIASCVGAVSFSEIEHVFGSNPGRLRKVIGLLASEFAAHEQTLHDAIGRRDFEAVQRTKHKMHTALEQLGLRELRESLGRIASGAADEAEHARCFFLLAAARAQIGERLRNGDTAQG